VIHSLNTAGHAPVDGRAAYDVDACAEVVRLAELLHDLLPDQPMPAAVLALLLLTEARRPARLDEHGDVVTLDQQDDTDWTEIMRLYATAHLDRSQSRRRPGPGGCGIRSGRSCDRALHAGRTAAQSPLARGSRRTARREGRYAEAALALAESLDGPATQPERQYREGRRETFLRLAMPRPPAEGALKCR